MHACFQKAWASRAELIFLAHCVPIILSYILKSGYLGIESKSFTEYTRWVFFQEKYNNKHILGF